MEPALPPRVPLHRTTSRCVHALRKSSSGQRRWARQCLSMDTAGLPDRAFIVPWKCTVDGLQSRECGCGLRMVLGLRWVAFGPRDGVSRVGFLGLRVGLAKAVRYVICVGSIRPGYAVACCPGCVPRWHELGPCVGRTDSTSGEVVHLVIRPGYAVACGPGCVPRWHERGPCGGWADLTERRVGASG